ARSGPPLALADRPRWRTAALVVGDAVQIDDHRLAAPTGVAGPAAGQGSSQPGRDAVAPGVGAGQGGGPRPPQRLRAPGRPPPARRPPPRGPGGGPPPRPSRTPVRPRYRGVKNRPAAVAQAQRRWPALVVAGRVGDTD